MSAGVKAARRNARTTLVLLLLGVVALAGALLWGGHLDALKVVIFGMVAVFVLWAVLTETSEWDADGEAVSRRRWRRPRKDLSSSAGSEIAHTPSPVAGAQRVDIRRTRDRGPEGRRRRLRRLTAHPIAVWVVLIGIVVTVLIGLLRGYGALRFM